MVDCIIRGIPGPYDDIVSWQTSDACHRKWKQRGSHRSRSMACRNWIETIPITFQNKRSEFF